MIKEEVENSLRKLHKELDRLAPAIEHIELLKETIETVKNIPAEHARLIEIIKDSDTEFKDELVKHVKEDIDALIDSNKKLNEILKETSSSNSDLILELKKYSEKIDNYLTLISSIDFPARLSSIEADINSTSSALNNLQGSISNLQVEQNRLSDKIILKLEKQTESYEQMNKDLVQKIESAQKQIVLISVAAAVIVGVLIIMVLK
jgi:chromosome segregation ATPase